MHSVLSRTGILPLHAMPQQRKLDYTAMNEYYLFGVAYNATDFDEPHCRFCGDSNRGTYCILCKNDGWWCIERCWIIVR